MIAVQREGPWAAAVCVPVRNEAVLLPRLLDAIARQRGVSNFVLCLFFDACSDDSVPIVAARAGALPYPIVTAEAGQNGPANAGLARLRAMALGLSVLREDGIILSTDGDSEPGPDWLTANIAALAHADVVAGRVVRTAVPTCAVQDRLEVYYDDLFALRRLIDPVPWEAARTHHYTSGASLGFRVDAYRLLGGFEPVPFAEDARLIDAAHRTGLRVRRDATIRVETSSRRNGRAIGGLADHLRNLDKEGPQATMSHPADEAWRYERHAAARVAWHDLSGRRRSLAAMLGCIVGHVDRIAADTQSAEAFVNCIVPEIPGGARQVELDEAEQILANFFGSRQGIAA
ncbi:glycosyltransferase family 2 protein [Sphingomonas immobilis]|uniref:Glycosyltransferase n=1 Tax=Sphingomonas immobilis TaxID=3063997 RepID=A0ABT8ZZ63_9SPHN|nr:glycosyltransferase [Sphingomonas sp. CA1-15]MDO7842878.1 glycosyltransferase [Sphingomonas sp. CA1-15]